MCGWMGWDGWDGMDGMGWDGWDWMVIIGRLSLRAPSVPIIGLLTGFFPDS